MNQELWESFLPFKSVHFTQKYLRSIYEQKNYNEPLSYSYKNGYTFCYYIDHGRKFYQQAEIAPYELKPILLFYGAVQLLKAILLTVDEKYPQNVDVLAHGMSSRKRKSNNYEFSQDTVLIQKRGLFTCVAKDLFNLDLEGIKFKMGDLLMRIPDLQDLFYKIRGIHTFYPIISMSHSTFKVSANILDDLHMTPSRFYEFLQDDINPIRDSKGELYFELYKHNSLSSVPYFQSDMTGVFYIPSIKANFFELPEILTHLILLYNLSMISRYETEWWSELFLEQSSLDLPFIYAFLDITEKKFPQMIMREFLDFKNF